MKSDQFIEDAMRNHSNALFRIACNMLNSEEAARDATQDAFIKLFQSDKEFTSDDHVRNWLIRVVRNGCIDRQRHAQTVVVELVDPTEPDAIERLMGDRAQLSRSAVEIDEDHFLWRHVASLSDAERQAVHLRYAEDLSPREIAELTGQTYAATCTRLFRACKKLRHMVETERKGKEDKHHETINEKTIRDLPQADPNADVRRRSAQRDASDHPDHEGRASPRRSRRGARCAGRRPDDEDGLACAEAS